MHLKRYYKPETLVEGTPIVDYVKVLKASKLWRPSKEVVLKALEDGWMRFDQGKLVVKTEHGSPDLVYTVLFRPGMYCCHCGAPLSKTDPNTEMPAAHLDRVHFGKKSPDPQNPGGYRILHSYELQLVEEAGWLARFFRG